MRGRVTRVMAHKQTYKIPSALDRSFLDHEVPISGGGMTAPPIPLKVILFWLGSIMMLFWVMSQSWVSSSAWFLQVFVVIWWLLTTLFLGKHGKTKELNIFTIPALINYVPAAARRVTTRSKSSPSGFYSLVGIDEIDETGFIRWNDGTVGQAYSVVGSASVLLFESDRQAILDRVDAYWRKSDTNIEHIFITTKEPQKVWKQMLNLERQNQNLVNRDPELFELMDEKYEILKDYVGGQFNSVHQYLILKGDNPEALRRGHILLQAEAEDSRMMFRDCSTLDDNDVIEMLRTIYRPAA